MQDALLEWQSLWSHYLNQADDHYSIESNKLETQLADETKIEKLKLESALDHELEPWTTLE